MTRTLLWRTAPSAILAASAAFAQNQTVTGQLIDLGCYSQDKANTGNEHKNRGLVCAQACAREGFPVGLLTSDGKVYEVTGQVATKSNAWLVPYMGKTVTLVGEIGDRNGRPAISANQLQLAKP
jgi:hypothetical protein